MRLRPSEEVVSVRLKELGEWDDRPTNVSQPKEGRRQKSQGQERGPKADLNSSKPENRPGVIVDERGQNGARMQSWLAPHIRVKFVDKTKGNGR